MCIYKVFYTVLIKMQCNFLNESVLILYFESQSTIKEYIKKTTCSKCGSLLWPYAIDYKICEIVKKSIKL